MAAVLHSMRMRHRTGTDLPISLQKPLTLLRVFSDMRIAAIIQLWDCIITSITIFFTTRMLADSFFFVFPASKKIAVRCALKKKIQQVFNQSQ